MQCLLRQQEPQSCIVGPLLDADFTNGGETRRAREVGTATGVSEQRNPSGNCKLSPRVLLRKSQTFGQRRKNINNITIILLALRNWCCVYRTTNQGKKEEFEEEILRKGTLGLYENDKPHQTARVSISKAFSILSTPTVNLGLT